FALCVVLFFCLPVVPVEEQGYTLITLYLHFHSPSLLLCSLPPSPPSLSFLFLPLSTLFVPLPLHPLCPSLPLSLSLSLSRSLSLSQRLCICLVAVRKN